MHTDSETSDISHLGFMHYMIAASLEMSDEPKIFTLFAIVMVAMSASAAKTKCLKLTQANAKTNAWDTQVFVKLQNLDAGKKYYVIADVMATKSVTISTEAIDDMQSAHKDQWGNSAIFNYTAEINATTEWSTCGSIEFPGVGTMECHSHCSGAEANNHNGCTVEKLTDFEYAPTAILIGVGKVSGELYIDNIIVKDEAGNVVYTQDFENASYGEYDNSKDVHTFGWQLTDNGNVLATWEIVEVERADNSTAISNVANDSNDAVRYNVAGQRVDANASGLQIVRMSNGVAKKVIKK